VPTIWESGVPNFDVNPWWGILAPAGISPAIVHKINADVAEVLGTTDMQILLAKHGASPFVSSPDEFAKLLQADIDKWAKAVKAAGARIN
jgi:tripartite-type tricarboxylate transporter receptor subunit TctC